jgi:IS30 family transposase
VDRNSKYTKLSKLSDKTAQAVLRASKQILSPLAERVQTITYDNGKEFAAHAEIATLLNAQTYFAKPYHSWERGLNEHTNGLVRQYFPKGTDFSTITKSDVQRVENKLNSRPPKGFGLSNPKRGILISALNALLHFTVEWAQ